MTRKSKQEMSISEVKKYSRLFTSVKFDRPHCVTVWGGTC